MRSFIERFSDEFYNRNDDSNRRVIFSIVKTIINNLRVRNINSIMPLKFVTINVKIVLIANESTYDVSSMVPQITRFVNPRDNESAIRHTQLFSVFPVETSS